MTTAQQTNYHDYSGPNTNNLTKTTFKSGGTYNDEFHINDSGEFGYYGTNPNQVYEHLSRNMSVESIKRNNFQRINSE